VLGDLNIRSIHLRKKRPDLDGRFSLCGEFLATQFEGL